MNIARKLAAHPMLLTTLLLTTIWVSASPMRAAAQQGENAVCNSATPPTGIKCSGAFIDASILTGTDICAQIFNALALLPTTGGVVDARGISSGLTCTTDTPWVQATSTTVPADILLPVGTITIGTTWVLPNHTRIIGVGTGSFNTSGTVIKAGASFSGPMIEMGSSGVCTGTNHVCNGVVVEHLMLNGASQQITGILNEYSEELSYVDHVNLYQILGTGLDIETSSGSYSAGNSGPYSNISFSTNGGGVSGTGGTECVKILGARTRGIHGLTCIADGTPAAAILIDADDNSIEDVHMEGFIDGILVGDSASAASNILFNITGSIGGGSMTNVIHISNANTVADLSIVNVESEIIGTQHPTNSIKDDVTSTTLTDTTVGVYALGETVGGGVSRFTTSPNAVTWGVGSAAPAGTCLNGSIFSDTGATAAHALYVCQSSAWVGK